MMKLYRLLLLVFLSGFQFAYASGHFVYMVREDGIYCGPFGRTKFKEADIATFELKGSIDSGGWGRMDRFAKDKNHVYDYCHIVEGIDPDGFEVIIDWDFVKTRNHVYYTLYPKWLLLEGADPETFTQINNRFFKDKSLVFYRYAPNRTPYLIPDADAESFEILSPLFAKDKNRVFYLLKEDWKERFVVLEGADTQSFHMTTEGYGKDKNGIYKNEQ